MDLFAEFANLPSARSAKDFTAIALSTHRSDFLAKANDGSPVFLLHDSSPAGYQPAIQLKNVSVEFQTTCRVSSRGTSIEDQFAVVTCDATEPELHEIFVRCVAAAAYQLPVRASTTDLQRCIQGLLELFRAFSRPSSRELVGLWAELFLIARATDTTESLRAWHADWHERFDFSWPGGCLEVKATIQEQRQHDFALEQLHEPTGGSGFVVSMLMQPMNGGVGVLQLATEIERAVAGNSQLRQKLWANIATALGTDFSERLDRRFDTSYAERSLVVYSMHDIPIPQISPDPRISDVRFRVDLSSVRSSLPGTTEVQLQSLFL